jgi:hypothetical protein
LRAFLVRFPAVVFLAVFLAAAAERRLADFFADLFADFLTDFFAGFRAAALFAFFARFGAACVFLARATATGVTIIGSETRPSAASGT